MGSRTASGPTALDAASGVSFYRIHLDGEEIATTTWGFYGLRALPAGDHVISVDMWTKQRMCGLLPRASMSSRAAGCRPSEPRRWWSEPGGASFTTLASSLSPAFAGAYIWIGRRARGAQKPKLSIQK